MNSSFEVIFEPEPKHSCHPWTFPLNRQAGTVIQCMTCEQLWILILDGPHRERKWVKPSRRVAKKLKKTLNLR